MRQRLSAVPRFHIDRATSVAGQLALFTRLQWVVAAVAAAAAALLTGLPTDVVPNSLFRRMTPIPWWTYPVWVVTAVLAGLVAATYVRRRPPGASMGSGAFAGSLLSFLAVGCPVCNKLVVALLGVSGALTFFAPLQPILAGAGISLLAATLVLRLRMLVDCRSEPS